MASFYVMDSIVSATRHRRGSEKKKKTYDVKIKIYKGESVWQRRCFLIITGRMMWISR